MNGRRGHKGKIKVNGLNREPIYNSKPEGQATHNSYCTLRVASWDSPTNIFKCKTIASYYCIIVVHKQ